MCNPLATAATPRPPPRVHCRHPVQGTAVAIVLVSGVHCIPLCDTDYSSIFSSTQHTDSRWIHTSCECLHQTCAWVHSLKEALCRLPVVACFWYCWCWCCVFPPIICTRRGGSGGCDGACHSCCGVCARATENNTEY